MNDQIIIKGARENNLKSINLSLPKNKLIVMTGLSGSGKTSLAFDTIYEEGRRRYVESLSSYARQDCLRRFQSTKKPLRTILGRLSAPSLRSMTMSDCFMPESESLIVRSMA